MPHLPPRESIQLQNRPGLTLLQRNSRLSEGNLTLQLCREQDRSKDERSLFWTPAGASLASGKEKAVREEGGSHTSFESLHGAAKPPSHPGTQHPHVEESRRE